MSLTVELYPGATAFLRKELPDFNDRQQETIQRYVEEISSSYARTLEDLRAKHEAGVSVNGSVHVTRNQNRLATIEQARSPSAFKMLPGADMRVTNFLYEYERKLIAEDNTQIQMMFDHDLITLDQQMRSGLIPTEHVVLGDSEYPLTPQTNGFKATGPGALDPLPPQEDRPYTPTHAKDTAKNKAEDISFRDIDRGGKATSVVDSNALAMQGVRRFVANLDAPAPKPEVTFPARLFEPIGAMPSNDIVTALKQPNGAMAYVQSVRKQMAALPAEDEQTYLAETLKPDRAYILSRLEKTDPATPTFAVMKGLDSFLKQQIAKIAPVPNPSFDMGEKEQVLASITPAKAPPAQVHVTLRDIVSPAVQAETKKTPPAFVSPLTESPAPAPVADTKFSPEKLEAFRKHIETKLRTADIGNLVRFDADILQTAQKETREEMMRRATDGTDRDTMQHILDYNDFIRSARNAVRDRVVAHNQTAESRAAAQAAKTLKEDATPEFMQPRKGFFAGIAEKFKRPEAAPSTLLAAPVPADVKGRLEAASVSTRATLEAELPHPEKPSLFQSLRSRVSDIGQSLKNNAGKITAAAAVAGAAIGAGLWMQSSAPDDAASAKTPATASVTATPSVAAKIAPASEATVTPAAPAQPATSQASDLPAQVLAPATPPASNSKASIAKADFSATAAATTVKADALTVTFNDGTTSRFDAETWKKACAQLKATSSPSTVCDELALKNG